jgi:hypothetical protein
MENQINNTYLVIIEHNRKESKIEAVIAEVLSLEFVNLFSFAKQEKISIKKLLISPDKYFSENLKIIKTYICESQFDIYDQEYLNKYANNIYYWETKFENNSKSINIDRYNNLTNLYSFNEYFQSSKKSISDYFFSESDEKDTRYLSDFNDFYKKDDVFSYHYKLINVEELDPHFIINFGEKIIDISYGNKSLIEVNSPEWKWLKLEEKEKQEKKQIKDNKIISAIKNKGFNWNIEDTSDVMFFLRKIKECDIIEQLDQESYNKWKDYKIKIGFEESTNKDFFDFRDFYLFFSSSDEDLNKLIKSPLFFSKKRTCNFCLSMTHSELSICYFCSFDETLNYYDKLRENFIDKNLTFKFNLIKKIRKLHKEIKEIKIQNSTLNNQKNYYSQNNNKWYQFNKVNKVDNEKINKFNELIERGENKLNSLEKQIGLFLYEFERTEIEKKYKPY